MLITVPRYILREFGRSFLLALVIFSCILLAFLAGQILQDGVGIFTILAIFPYLFPLASPLILPLTMITSCLICYGRLASHNEFSAAQAGGVHPAWLAMPTLVAALLATTITLYLNDKVLSAATDAIQTALVRDQTDILQRQIERSGTFLFGDLAICRLPRQRERMGVDITVFRTGKDRRKGEEPPRWHADYPHQAERILARHHHMALRPGLKGNFYITAELEEAQQIALESAEIVTPTAKQVIKHWPVGQTNREWRITSSRMSYWGISELLAKRRRLRSDLRHFASALLIPSDIKQWPIFAGGIVEDVDRGAPSPGRRVWELMTPEVQGLLRRAAQGENLTTGEREKALAALNRLLVREDFYDEQYFRRARLNAEGIALRHQERSELTAAQIARFHRLLLEASFPHALASRPLAEEDESIDALLNRPEATIFDTAVRDARKSLRKIMAELHLKTALSVACLAFAVFGMPLGLLMRRENTSVGFGIGIAVAAAFYLLVKTFEALLQAGVPWSPWWTIWLPNWLLFLGGAILWWRVRRAL
ncbi:MAG: LptF/LptG family permease [Planctomycetota bacterium]|nr:LptF/LptG family permease [Planctomycetota bacterium]